MPNAMGPWQGASEALSNVTSSALNLGRMQMEAGRMRAVEDISKRGMALQEKESVPRMEALTAQGETAKIQLDQARRKEEFMKSPWDPNTDPIIHQLSGGDDILKKDLIQRASQFPKTQEGRIQAGQELATNLQLNKHIVEYRDTKIVQDIQKQLKILSDPEQSDKHLAAKQTVDSLEKQHSGYTTAKMELDKRETISKEKLMPMLDDMKKMPEWKLLHPQAQMALNIAAKTGDIDNFNKTVQTSLSADARLSGLLQAALTRKEATTTAAKTRAGAIKDTTFDKQRQNAITSLEEDGTTEPTEQQIADRTRQLYPKGTKKKGISEVLGASPTGAGAQGKEPTLQQDGKGGFIFK